MNTPTPDTRPGAPPGKRAGDAYTRADKARDYRLVAKTLLTIGIAGTALTSLGPQGTAPRLSDWAVVVALSRIVAWKTTGAWKRRALLQAVGLPLVLLASLLAGPAGAWIFLAGMGVLTLTATGDAIRLMWTTPTTTSPPDTREDPGTTKRQTTAETTIDHANQSSITTPQSTTRLASAPRGATTRTTDTGQPGRPRPDPSDTQLSFAPPGRGAEPRAPPDAAPGRDTQVDHQAREPIPTDYENTKRYDEPTRAMIG